jgi:hypothetical protein
MQKLMGILESFFHDPTLWDFVCTVFTKSFSGRSSSKKETMRETP